MVTGEFVPTIGLFVSVATLGYLSAARQLYICFTTFYLFLHILLFGFSISWATFLVPITVLGYIVLQFTVWTTMQTILSEHLSSVCLGYFFSI